MKNSLTLIVAICLTHWAMAQSTYYNFYPGKEYYVYADEASLYTFPSLDSVTSVSLVQGTRVKVISAESSMDVNTIKNGLEAGWVTVGYASNGVTLVRYVRMQDLASGMAASRNRTLKILYSPVFAREDDFTLLVGVKVLKAGKLIAALQIDAVGWLYTYLETSSLGNRGLMGVKEVLVFNFSDGACGGAFGRVYLFWTGKKLLHGLDVSEGFDAPYFSNERVVFPADSGGVRGQVIQIGESGYYDDNNHLVIEESRKAAYRWNGFSLTKLP